jgi:hypothetical protein
MDYELKNIVSRVAEDLDISRVLGNLGEMVARF